MYIVSKNGMELYVGDISNGQTFDDIARMWGAYRFAINSFRITRDYNYA